MAPSLVAGLVIGALTLGVVLGVITTQWLNPNNNYPAAHAMSPPVHGGADVTQGRKAGVGGDSAPGLITDILTIAQSPSGFDRRAHYYAMAGHFSAEQLADAIDLVNRELTGNKQREAAIVLMSRFVEVDAMYALEFISSIEDFESAWFHIIFQELAHQDSDVALDLAINLPRRKRLGATSGIMQSLREESLAERIRVAYALNATRALMLRPEEFANAWQIASEQEDLVQKGTLMQHILSHWGTIDPQSALAAIDSSQFKLGNFGPAKLSIINQWATEAPEAALNWLLENGDRELRKTGLTNAFVHLARIDLPQAQARLEGMPKDLQSTLKGSLMPAMLSQDLSGTLARIEQNPDQKARQQDLAMAAFFLAQSDPDQLRYWVSTLDSRDQAVITAYTVATTPLADPVLAVEFLETYASGKQRLQLGRRLINQWVKQDPSAAAAWIADQPLEEANTYQRDLVRNWSRLDLEAAVDYATTLNPTVRDTSLLAAINRHDDSESDIIEFQYRAFNAIEDPTIKQQAAQKLARYIESKDPLEAQRLREAYPEPTANLTSEPTGTN